MEPSALAPSKRSKASPAVQQVRNIQFLRGAAAVGVVLHHVMLFDGKTFGPYATAPGVLDLGKAGVDLFFVISGFIMAYIEPVPLKTLASYIRFLIHRLTRIYPPLWAATLPILVIYFIEPTWINNSTHNKVDVIRSFLLLPQDYPPLLQVAWTLIHEVHFYCVVSLLLIFGKLSRVILGLVWFGVVVVMYCLMGANHFGGNCWLQLYFSPFSLTFLLGFFIGLWYDRNRETNWAFVILPGIIAVIGLALSVNSMPEPGLYPDSNSMYRFLYYGIPCACVVLAAVIAEKATVQKLPSLKHLGDESYAIYLIHYPVIVLTYKIIAGTHIQNHWFSIVVVVSLPFVCIGLAKIFHHWIEMPSTRYARRFLERMVSPADNRRVIPTGQ